jgi:hypothetical protein
MIQGARFSRKFGAKAVKLDHNTYLSQKATGEFQVVLHQTAIITIFPNETYRLDTGGWYTVTTKERLNQFGPVRINQQKGQWFLADGRSFQDGMIVRGSK